MNVRDLMTASGRELRMARYARSWSREQLAEMCGLTVDDIDAIENGASDVGRTRVLEILELDEMYVLPPQGATEFLEMAVPLMMRLDDDRLQLALAEMQVVLRRAVVEQSERDTQQD